MKYFVYSVTGVVVATVVAGFFIIGSPQDERLRKYDDRRVSDLQFLQSEIINYWTQKGKLPASPDLIRDDIRGISIPVDPETNTAYEYYVKNEDTFSLCAQFATNTWPKQRVAFEKQMSPPVPFSLYNQNWEHGIGYTCFERTIDKDIYQPRLLKQ